MGLLLNMIEKIQKEKHFTRAYESNNTCDDKYCLNGSINIFKTKEPDIYTISIDSSELFPSKEKLYEYYQTLYKSFDEHFKQVTELKDVLNHECTYEGKKVTLSKSGDYYGINEGLRFTGHMIDCRDWFYGTLVNLYEVCFN